MTDPNNSSKVEAKCPFCGSTDLFVERADYCSCFVQCNDCCCRGPVGIQDGDDEEVPGEVAALREWGKRAHETNRDPRTGMTPAEAEASRLKAALLAYGSHTDDCGLYGKRQGEPHECTCGLFEAQGLLPDGKPKHQSEKS